MLFHLHCVVRLSPSQLEVAPAGGDCWRPPVQGRGRFWASACGRALFFTETDPYVRFCKQRDHYENLINVENSDWSSFAEALRADIRLKQSRIRCLEEGLGLKVEEFGKNPAETQRRLLETAEKLSSLKEEEDKQIEQRLTLIKEQQEEIFRLHGLLSVEDKGKIIRKMR
ncbi:hypothetical protein HNY73_001390 [Argiope bruennichi]|uniref:Uncharacterized protein n=1 Tax=Argiope bruennichi TaxID=94029 RepID=A0A8T0G3J5_ARGBR|nr:hypothetical protein HNY73_001390 [Argiope bruennichi]